MSSTLRQPLIHAVNLEHEVERFKVYTQRDLDSVEELAQLPESIRFEMRVVSSVLPFRVNDYVIKELIDWSRVPDDPIFQLTFPQRKMLPDALYYRMAMAVRSGMDKQGLKALADEVRGQLNPHPEGQLELNVPSDEQAAWLDQLKPALGEGRFFF